MPGDIEANTEVYEIFYEILLLKWQTSGAAYRHNGKWWVRCSVQIWNEVCTGYYVSVRPYFIMFDRYPTLTCSQTLSRTLVRK